MKERMKRLIALFIVWTFIFTIVLPTANVRAEQKDFEDFYIYAWVVDENGNVYTKNDYEPGFVFNSMPNHVALNSYGAALLGVYKTPDNKYYYWVNGANAIHDKTGQNLTITKNYSVVKVELARKDSGNKTKYTVIEPDNPNYPLEPLNPSGKAENKVNIHGFVKDQNGGVADAVVSINNPSKFPAELYTITTTTDSSGYYCLGSVDDKRFGTAYLSAKKGGVNIRTTTNQDEYRVGTFGLWNKDTSYDFGVNSNIPVYSISVTGGSASYSQAPSGLKVMVTAKGESGKQFDQWTSPDGVTFDKPSSPATWFIMPNHAVQINGTYSDIPIGNVSVSAVTITPSSIGVQRGTSCQFKAVVQGNGPVSQEVGWTVKNASGSSVSADGLLTVSTNEKANSIIVMAVSKADPEKFAEAKVNIENSSSGSSSGTPLPTEPEITIQPDEKKPIVPSDDEKNILEINTFFIARKNKAGNNVITITGKKLKDAIANAQKNQTDFANMKNHLMIDLLEEDALPLQIVLNKEALTTLVNKKINQVDLQGKNISMTLDKDFLRYAQKQSDSGLTFQISKSSVKLLGKEAKKAIGTHPVYEVKATYVKKSGKKNITKEITDFKTGTVIVSLPYTLRKGETASNVCAVSIQETGKPEKIKGSVYSKKQKQLTFPIKRYSIIGIGKR